MTVHARRLNGGSESGLVTSCVVHDTLFSISVHEAITTSHGASVSRLVRCLRVTRVFVLKSRYINS